MNSAASILVISEDASLPMLSLTEEARRLADLLGGAVHVLLLQDLRCDDFFLCGASCVHILPALPTCADDALIARNVDALIAQLAPVCVLAGNFVRSKAIMALTAAAFHAGLTADCTRLSVQENGRLLQTRPALGSSVEADIITSSNPQFATVCVGALPVPQKRYSFVPEICYTQLEGKVQVILEGFNPFCGNELLSSARIVLAGGLGMGSREGFQKLYQISEKLQGSAVGASRAAVAAGLAPFASQIGQSGICVQPDVYIAFGVSGAIQHLAGMKLAKRIVAINHDPHAPIFTCCDYGIVDDCQTVAEWLLHTLC